MHVNFQYFFRHGPTSFVITKRPRKSWERDCQKCVHSDLLSVQCTDGGNKGGGAGRVLQPPPLMLNNN